MSRNVKIAAIVLAVVGVAIALFSSLAQGSQTSPLDASLKRTADAMKATLLEPDSRYSGQPAFLMAFQLYQADQRKALLDNMPRLSPAGQFVQIQVYETHTMPPVSLVLRSDRGPLILMEGDLIGQVAQGKSLFRTLHQGNQEFRAYLTPIQPPPSLASGGAQEVLEVFEVQKS